MTTASAHHGGDGGASLNRTAFSATVHCLTGCAIGEILGMVLSTWWGWSNTGNVVLSISLAFVFGYSLTMLPLLRGGLTLRRSLPLAFASDTLSIGTMELFDTLILLIVPGAINAGLGEPLFWASLAGALFVAFWAAFPVNRALIARGKGHAVIHSHHRHSHSIEPGASPPAIPRVAWKPAVDSVSGLVADAYLVGQCRDRWKSAAGRITTKKTVPPPRIGTMSSNALEPTTEAVAIHIATHRITAEARYSYSVRLVTRTKVPKLELRRACIIVANSESVKARRPGPPFRA